MGRSTGWRIAMVVVVSAWLATPARSALIFNFNVPDASKAPSASALAGFTAAANYWSSVFTDDITLNYDLYWEPLSPGVIGSASSQFVGTTYSNFKAALTADASSVDDATAVAHLPGGSSFDIYINRTVNNPHGANSATPYVDTSLTDIDSDGHANNNWIQLTRANAKAVGLIAANDAGLDGTIRFSSSFAFDYDPSDGITPGTMDFIGVAIHEIGHSLGFTSGVDVLDINGSGFYDDQFDFVRPLDLFRYSPESVDAGGVGTIDWTASTTAKWFSLDGGQTKVTGAGFSTGRTLGDGQQASHWKDHQGIGALDPTIAYGETVVVTDHDKRALDVIGWDLASSLSAVVTESMGSSLGAGTLPEPVVLAPLAGAFVLLRLTARPTR